MWGAYVDQQVDESENVTPPAGSASNSRKRRSRRPGWLRTASVRPPPQSIRCGTPTRSPPGAEGPRQAGQLRLEHGRRCLPGTRRMQWRPTFHQWLVLALFDTSPSQLRLVPGLPPSVPLIRTSGTPPDQGAPPCARGPLTHDDIHELATPTPATRSVIAPGQFRHLLTILADPDHEEYEQVAEWIDPDFDPEDRTRLATPPTERTWGSSQVSDPSKLVIPREGSRFPRQSATLVPPSGPPAGWPCLLQHQGVAGC